MIRPINDYVLVSIEREEKTKSGIILTTKEEVPQVGIVEAVGSGKVNENGVRVKPDVEIGQKVIFNKFAGTEIKEDGKLYLVLKEYDILAVI